MKAWENLKKLWKRSPVCLHVYPHSISCSLLLPLVFLYLNRNMDHVFYFLYNLHLFILLTLGNKTAKSSMNTFIALIAWSYASIKAVSSQISEMSLFYIIINRNRSLEIKNSILQTDWHALLLMLHIVLGIW